jgi:hypothetical protein
MEIFNKHKNFFEKDSYEKHLLFDSEHLVGMIAEFKYQNRPE